MAYSNCHIFFDLDKTLWDFDTNSEAALRQLYNDSKELSEKISFAFFHKAYLRKNKVLWHAYSNGKLKKERLRYERFRATFQQFHISDETLVKKFGDGYVELSPRQKVLMPHTKSVLNDLAAMGFNLHIITNGFLEVQHIKLKEAGIHHLFNVILCSEEVGVSKPNPRIFKSALRLANAESSKSLMVGDDYRADILGAHKSGMQALWFQKVHNRQAKYEMKITCLTEIPMHAAKLLLQ